MEITYQLVKASTCESCSEEWAELSQQMQSTDEGAEIEKKKVCPVESKLEELKLYHEGYELDTNIRTSSVLHSFGERLAGAYPSLRK